MHITRGSIFKDIGFGEEEAKDLEVRSFLAVKITDFVQRNNFTQQKAADFFGVPRPKITNIMSGNLSGISAEYMIKLLLETGGKLNVSFRQPSKATVKKLLNEKAA